MEMFIQLKKNFDGSRGYQSGGDMQNDQAYWNTDVVPLPEKFPWVEIETQEVSHDAVMDGNKVLIPAFTRLEVVSATGGKRLDKPTRKRWTTSKVIALGVLVMDAVATLSVLALCGLDIVRRFDGALPYLTTLIGALQAVTGVVPGGIFPQEQGRKHKRRHRLRHRPGRV